MVLDFERFLVILLTTCFCSDMGVLSRIDGENFDFFFPILWLFSLLMWVFYFLYVSFVSSVVLSVHFKLCI